MKVFFIAMAAVLCCAAATTQPVKLEKRWHAKNGAPAEVVAWVATLPERHRAAVDRLKGEIAAEKNTLERIVKEPVATMSVRTALGGYTQVPDPKSAADKRRRVEEQRQKIREMWKRVKPLEDDTLWKGEPECEIGIGGFGMISSARVLQVVDDKNFIATCGSSILWFAGFDAKDIVDDALVTMPQGARIASTKTYNTRIGTKKVFVAEPFDYREWMEIVEVPQAQRSDRKGN